MTERRNARVMALAWQLEHLLSSDVTSALEAISERVASANGYPTQCIGASPPAGEPRPEMTGECGSCERMRPCPYHDGATLTTVERAADVRYRDGLHREEIRDRLDGLEITVREFLSYLRGVIGRPTADVTQAVPMCRDNQTGKHAAHEWGDPTCPMPSIGDNKGGLCQQHWWAWYRARRRDGIRTSADHEPAA